LSRCLRLSREEIARVRKGSTMQVTRVDERDGGWEDPHPRFRVYLHGSGETTTGGWTDTYDITGADVLQVIDWAQRQAGDRLTYAVALVRDDPDEKRRNPGYGRGLVWLVGMTATTPQTTILRSDWYSNGCSHAVDSPSGYPRQTGRLRT
jgi:hypothetical protein